MLRADKDNRSVSSDEQVCKNFQRIDFGIDNKNISRNLIEKLYTEYNSLLSKRVR